MYAFSASHRLGKPEDYDAVFKRVDYRVSDQSLALLARRRQSSASEAPHRLGLVVGKKAVAKAVKRNLLKRLAREAFRKADLGTKGLDLVFLARPVKGGRAASREAWRESVAALFAGLRRQLAAGAGPRKHG